MTAGRRRTFFFNQNWTDLCSISILNSHLFQSKVHERRNDRTGSYFLANTFVNDVSIVLHFPSSFPAPNVTGMPVVVVVVVTPVREVDEVVVRDEQYESIFIHCSVSSSTIDWLRKQMGRCDE